MTEDTAPNKPDDKTPEKPEEISCANFMILSTTLFIFMATIRFNTLVLLSPIVIVPVLWIHNKYRPLSGRARWNFLYATLFFASIFPVDIAFRPGPRFAVKHLPILQCAGAYGHVRQRIYEGQRENVDFIAMSSSCSGPRYADSAVVIFYPSRFTSRYGRTVTTEDAEKHVQETIQTMKEWERPEEAE